jgi:small subunit ribosomal protein S16
MAVRIRLKRIGSKNHPAFRIVVADSRSPRDGKCIEELGSYLPTQKGTNFKLDLERARSWGSPALGNRGQFHQEGRQGRAGLAGRAHAEFR